MPVQAAEELTTGETPLYKAVFTNAGGAIKSLELKNYHRGEKDPVVVNVAQKVAVLNSFKSQFDINGVVETPVFSSAKKSFNLTGDEKAELVYTGTFSNGLVIEKKFVFSADAYFIQTEVSALNRASTAVSVRSDIVLSAPVSGKDDTGYHQGPIVKTAKELIRQDEDCVRGAVNRYLSCSPKHHAPGPRP